jgi:hypothetical protein
MNAPIRPGEPFVVRPGGSKPMKILHITTTDPAGSAFNFINAINTHTHHRARLFTSARIPQYDFRSDISSIFDTGDELEQLLVESDVFHFHKVIEDDMEIEFELENMGIKKNFSVKDFVEIDGKKKKIVYHIHGHPSERNNPELRAIEYAKKGRMVLASTPDLEEIYKPLYDQVMYFPNCVPINDVRYLPRASDKMLPFGKIKEGSNEMFMTYILAQSPTNTILKNVDMIKEIVEKLADENLPIRYVQIWNAPHDTTLRHKRNAHIVFDHIEGYYGLSSLEALSMGKPVIAGLSDYSIEAIGKFFNVSGPAALPWQVARNAEEVERQIRFLLSNDDLRRNVGAFSRAFMEDVWSDKIIANRLVDFYASL